MNTTLLLVVLFSSPALGQSPESLQREGAQAFEALEANPLRLPGGPSAPKTGPGTAASSEVDPACGLPRYSGDTEMVVFGEPLWVENARGLSALDRLRVLTTARMLAAHEEEPPRIGSVADAVRFLKENSEGEDLYITNFRFRGREFTKVVHYPGGNPQGVVFAAGAAEVVAAISDSSLRCTRPPKDGGTAAKADYSHRWSGGKCMAFTGDGREVYAVDVSYCGGYDHRWSQGECRAFTGDGHEVYLVDVSYCGGYAHRWSGGRCVAFTGDGREVYGVDVSYCGGYVHRWSGGRCVAFTGDGREVYGVDVSYCD